MSYILDALRRAESERQRGQVPNLAAVPAMSAGHAALAPSQRASKPLLLLLALVALALAAAWVWWWRAPAAAPPVQASPPPGAAGLPVERALPEPVAAVAPLPRVVSAPPLAAVAAPPAPHTPPPASLAKVMPPAAEAAAIKLGDLPPALRAQWPALNLGGSVWSDSPSSRFVIVNGQVLREGETAAPGLVLDRIQPKSAVFRWRELRVELPL